MALTPHRLYKEGDPAKDPDDNADDSESFAKRSSPRSPPRQINKVASTLSQRSRSESDCPPGMSPITTQGQNFFGGTNEYYNLKEVLGEGSYGSVYRCQRAADSQICAVKIIDPRRLGFVGGEEGVRAVEAMAAREVAALRCLAAHPGIISLEGAFRSEATRQIFIVTEFVAGSHLFSYIIDRSEAFTEPEVAFVFAQLADALTFCHSLGVAHRDLKLENVLVGCCDVRLSQDQEAQELFTVKICDFGFAKSIEGFTTATPVGTANYMAPEVEADPGVGVFETLTKHLADPHGIETSDTKYDAFKADVFSLGVMTFVMLTHSYPAKEGGEGVHRLHKCWPDLSEDCKVLVDGLLAADPALRFDMAQAKRHPWLQLAPTLQDAEQRQISVSTDDPGFSEARRRAKTETHPEIRGILVLQHTFVMMQHERANACWALGGAPGVGGISCWDQLRSYVQLTDRNIISAQDLLWSSSSETLDSLDALVADLAKARQLAFGVEESHASASSFDGVFLAYNHAIVGMIEIVAGLLEAINPADAAVRRAVRRYRLFCTAVEQLGRERTFICGHHQQDWSPKRGYKKIPENGLPLEKLRKLGEIVGARKVLLGTIVGNGSQMSGDIVATSTGLIGTLIG